MFREVPLLLAKQPSSELPVRPAGDSLQLAQFGKEGGPEVVPKISQEMRAEMGGHHSRPS
jgi:hypothetical protein